MSGDRPEVPRPEDDRPDADARAAAGPDPLADPTVPVARALDLTPASDVARAALARARAAAEARGLRPGMAPRRRPKAADATWTGRDPLLLGDTVDRLATEHGWSTELSVAGVIGRWPEMVGPDVAAHSTPETFEDARLVVRTDSTAWATELRRLVPDLLRRLAEELGPDVVTEVTVLGPVGPGWGRGARRVPGRGPRDTYG